jgi:predicted nucleotidyltransferase
MKRANTFIQLVTKRHSIAMNIIINEEEHEWLQQQIVKEFIVGSHLYGTSNADSDTDYLCLYQTSEVELYSGLPNVHQFQYKDEIASVDWNYCSALQFWKNLYKGDSTINADIILFTDYRHNKLEICRTYKIIKAYLGFAKRDIKQISKEGSKKAVHAARGLYCAEMLLKNELPSLQDIQQVYLQRFGVENLQVKEQHLRAIANQQYDDGLLKNYYIEECSNPLLQKLLNSNNNKEFRY